MPTEQELKEIIQKVVNSYPEKWVQWICAFTFVDKATGALSGAPGGAACHGSLSYGMKPNQIVINAHKPLNHGAHPEFTRWVCRESPFAHGVLNKDNDDEILNHASVIDPDLVGNGGTLWLCKALRYTVEDAFRVPMWERLREAGLNGFQAFIGCSILNYAGEPEYYTTHNSLFGYSTPTNLRKVHDEILGLKKIEGANAARTGIHGVKNWGSIGFKNVQKPDGWGGFTEVKIPQDANEFAKQLKEICEGDPMNVG